MAVLKHLYSKNSNYGQILDYMLFQHNEITGRPIKDELGNKILRNEYYIDGINCEAMTFDQECKLVNRHFRKNQNPEDIKSHHYILSFDPRDATDHGLTGERAQALGLEFAQKNFPGHQALVCTHTDGHNQSGNIHVHITINSVRKHDVERTAFMERPCDSLAGYKHNLTSTYLEHLQQEVMDLCEREQLYQVDLLNPSSKKITEKEYWASRKGQKKLDALNQRILDDGLCPTNTKYVTQKESLRNAIEDITTIAKTMDEFKRLLKEKYNIDVIEKRGRFSFHLPDREKNISERSLGTNYGKTYIEKCIQENAKEEKNREAVIFPDDTDKEIIRIIFMKSNLRLVVDLQTCVKAQQNEAYARKVKLSNLKEMAKTIAYIQEKQLDTVDTLQQKYKDVSHELTQSYYNLKDTESLIRDINNQIRYTGQYLSNKAVYSGLLQAKNKSLYWQEHQEELTAYETATRWLRERNSGDRFPSMKSLQAEKQQLLLQKDEQSDLYHYFKNYKAELDIVRTNIDIMLGHPKVKCRTHQYTR